MSWSIDFTTRARKDLRRLDRQNQAMVVDGIVRLAETGQGDVVQLKNVRPPQWRLRVGDWRVRFKKHVQEQRLEILHIRHRSKAYDR